MGSIDSDKLILFRFLGLGKTLKSIISRLEDHTIGSRTYLIELSLQILQAIGRNSISSLRELQRERFFTFEEFAMSKDYY